MNKLFIFYIYLKKSIFNKKSLPKVNNIEFSLVFNML